MSDATARPLLTMLTGLLLGVLLGIVAGWGTLVLGGHTDDSGRMGLVLGAAVFALVGVGWGRGRRGWLWGLASATVLGGVMLAHFVTRIGHP